MNKYYIMYSLKLHKDFVKKNKIKRNIFIYKNKNRYYVLIYKKSNYT